MTREMSVIASPAKDGTKQYLDINEVASLSPVTILNRRLLRYLFCSPRIYPDPAFGERLDVPFVTEKQMVTDTGVHY